MLQLCLEERRYQFPEELSAKCERCVPLLLASACSAMEQAVGHLAVPESCEKSLRKSRGFTNSLALVTEAFPDENAQRAIVVIGLHTKVLEVMRSLQDVKSPTADVLKHASVLHSSLQACQEHAPAEGSAVAMAERTFQELEVVRARGEKLFVDLGENFLAEAEATVKTQCDVMTPNLGGLGSCKSWKSELVGDSLQWKDVVKAAEPMVNGSVVTTLLKQLQSLKKDRSLGRTLRHLGGIPLRVLVWKTLKEEDGQVFLAVASC